MPNLFENGSYVITARAHDIVQGLRDTHVKAVTYRNPVQARAQARLRDGITALDVPAIAQQYQMKDGLMREAKSGQIIHTKNFTPDEIAAQAAEAGIALNNDALLALTRDGNRSRTIYTSVYRDFTGDLKSPICAHVLFTPKGGTGRSPEIHADFLAVVGHKAVALSTLDLPEEDLGDAVWNSINRARLNDLSSEAQAAEKEKMVRLGRMWQHKFRPTMLDDFVFVKGQRGRNLDLVEDRQQVGIHKSSGDIEENGQVAFLFFTRTPKLDAAPA